MMLGDSVAGLVLVTAASKKPGAPGNNRPSTSLTGRFGTYSKKWMITSFTPGKMAINAAAPIIAHPEYRMACG